MATRVIVRLSRRDSWVGQKCTTEWLSTLENAQGADIYGGASRPTRGGAIREARKLAREKGCVVVSVYDETSAGIISPIR